MKHVLDGMMAEFKEGFALSRIFRGFVFCLVSFPVVVVTMFALACALNEGGGNPSLGIAKSVIAVAETYQTTSQPGMLSKHFSVCSLPPIPHAPQPSLPIPMVNCHPEAALVAADKVIADIAHGITQSYGFLVEMGFAGLCLLRLYRIVQAGRYRYPLPPSSPWGDGPGLLRTPEGHPWPYDLSDPASGDGERGAA
jgi:hypothetical protein